MTAFEGKPRGWERRAEGLHKELFKSLERASRLGGHEKEKAVVSFVRSHPGYGVWSGGETMLIVANPGEAFFFTCEIAGDGKRPHRSGEPGRVVVATREMTPEVALALMASKGMA